MSRLIDADALLKGHQDHEMISTHLVWNAPTVEAIPISFIKEIIRIWDSFAPRYCELTARDFEWLIEKWGKDRDLVQLKSELKKIEEDAFK